MHLTASGPAALGCEMHQIPTALGFPTQLPGSILIPIAFAQRTGTSLMSQFLLRVPVNTSAMGATSSKRRSSAMDLRKTSIENIPEPLILEIFSYLSMKELCQIAR